MSEYVKIEAEDGWVGEVVSVTKDEVDMGWSWADPDCKSRRHETWTYRMFYTDPLPPKTNEKFLVKPLGEENSVLCYSNGECLISIYPVVTVWTEYVPSLWDRIKAVFKR